MILLHRPFASPDSGVLLPERSPKECNSSSGFLQHLVSSSTSSCLNNAIRIALIFRFKRQYSGIQMCSIMALDHARVAANVLLSAHGQLSKTSSRTVLREYLHAILRVMEDVSQSMEPANRIAKGIKDGFHVFDKVSDKDIPTISCASSQPPKATRYCTSIEDPSRPSVGQSFDDILSYTVVQPSFQKCFRVSSAEDSSPDSGFWDTASSLVKEPCTGTAVSELPQYL